MPSGHALIAAVTAVAVALILTQPGRSRRLAIAAAVAWSILVALSRTYLSAHWLTDVLDCPVTATSEPAGRGRSTSALTGPMHSSAHSSASANTASARQRREIASAAAITPRTTHMTVPPATTLSTFAVKTPCAWC